MTISAVWSGVLSWLKKWRLTRWEFDPRTEALRDVATAQGICLESLERSVRVTERVRDEWQRTAAERLVEINQLRGANELALERNESERAEFKRELAAVCQRYDGHPDIDTYKKCLDELRQKHDAAVALNRSREEEITKLNREYATLRAEHAAEIDRLKQECIQINARFDAQQEAMDAHLISQYADAKEATIDKLREENAELRRTMKQSTTIWKLRKSREESKRLRAKLAAITDRNGAIFDHPEYRKVARRLRAARARLPRGGLITFDGVPLRRSPFVGQPFCVNRFAPSPEIAYVEERQYGTAPSRSINTDILDTICGVTQVPQSERGPLVNGC